MAQPQQQNHVNLRAKQNHRAVRTINNKTSCSYKTYVTQRELMRLFEGDIKTDILNSTYCSISKEHFDTKTIFIWLLP